MVYLVSPETDSVPLAKATNLSTYHKAIMAIGNEGHLLADFRRISGLPSSTAEFARIAVTQLGFAFRENIRTDEFPEHFYELSTVGWEYYNSKGKNKQKYQASLLMNQMLNHNLVKVYINSEYNEATLTEYIMKSENSPEKTFYERVSCVKSWVKILNTHRYGIQDIQENLKSESSKKTKFA